MHMLYNFFTKPMVWISTSDLILDPRAHFFDLCAVEKGSGLEPVVTPVLRNPSEIFTQQVGGGCRVKCPRR